MGVTGLSPDSFKNMQLNAGIFIEDFDYDDITTVAALKTAIETARSAGKVFGATVGDGSFQCTPETRQIEANGMRYPIIGSTVIDSWDIQLTGTMKEITGANFKRVLATASSTTTGAVTKITMRTDVLASDYLNNVVWIGDMLDTGLVLIGLKNAMNTNGANFTFTDKGEGSLPFEFHAHCATLADMANAPVDILLFAPTT